jgi:hypothetical protein
LTHTNHTCLARKWQSNIGGRGTDGDLVAMINAANRLKVIVHNQGGSYEPALIASVSS